MKVARKKTKAVKIESLVAANYPDAAPVIVKTVSAADPIPAIPAPQPAVSVELIEPAAKQVFVAGSFNGWRPDSTPLMPQRDGRWKGSLALGPGRHEYLFVVDGQWRPDPNAAESVQNPFGGRNSVITVSV